MPPHPVEIRHLYVSRGHNFFGHYGGPAGRHPIEERAAIRCVAGHGIEDDRFFDHKENYKGQITFFSWDIFEALRAATGATACAPSAMRRNVLLAGLDLNTLVGRRFALQGVIFEGTEECRPCAWMDQAVGAGAEVFLRGRGGLRGRILTDGTLRKGPAHFALVEDDVPRPA
jgi:MOSC domain-containing protein YiiM